MSNLKTYFKNVMSVCKKGFAYVRDSLGIDLKFITN